MRTRWPCWRSANSSGKSPRASSRCGAKLNEVDIATALGVSRGPVREAFRALEQAGLVRVEKNRGVFVRQVSLAEADEIYEVRAVLEELIGRLAGATRRADEVDQLRACVKA